MSDQVTVKMDQGQRQFTPTPVGTHHAVCVDIIDMGESVEQYQDQAPYLTHKVVLVFQADEQNAETGKRYEPSIEFTATFGPKSKLRKMLGAWRGKPYSDEEAMAGAPLHKLLGVNAMLNVLHKTSKAERTYAVIDSISPPMKSLPKIVAHEYTRSEHWAKRKEEYAAKVAAFKTAPPAPNFNELPPALQPEDDSDLPF
jgi:hypothetical protein